jgi:GGDEF domain-containing protein
MPDDLLPVLHASVNCYLSVLETVAHALAEACPPVGKPYGQRLSRLRARLAFDSGRAKLEESCIETARELRDYAQKASTHAEAERAELRRGLIALEQIVRSLAQRQEFYGERLRRFAAEMEKDRSPEAVELHVAGLLSSIESMSHEAQSLLRKMHGELAQVESRLEAIEITDRATGLLNRREMERAIAALRERGEEPVLLLFEFHENLPDEAARQAAERLNSQFRHHDLIARWSNRQFLVLFHGPEEIARARGEQIVPWLAGHYQLSDGAAIEVAVEVHFDHEALSAQAGLLIA